MMPLMQVSAIDAILWEVGDPLALFKGGLRTPERSPVPKGLKDFQHVFEFDGSLLYWFGGSAERVRVGIVAVTVDILIAVIVYVAFAAITAAAAIAVSFAASYSL
jgi:hypothetical protein